MSERVQVPGISLKQLRYFSALADAGHFGRAAERVGISQPSLSLQVSNLEAELGVRLVERGGGVRLTPAGRDVLARCRRVLGEVEGIVDSCRALRGGPSGTFLLGSSPTLGPYFLPRVFQRLRLEFPDLRLVVREDAPAALQRGLREGQHDLIVTQLPVASDAFRIERLFREPLHLAVAADHRLAGRAEVAPDDLRGEEILTLGPEFTLHDQVAELSARCGAILRRDYEGTSLDALRQMTAMNMGLTFLPALYVASEPGRAAGDVRILRFDGGRFTRSIGIAWRRGAGKQAGFERILAMAREVAMRELAGLVICET